MSSSSIEARRHGGGGGIAILHIPYVPSHVRMRSRSRRSSESYFRPSYPAAAAPAPAPALPTQLSAAGSFPLRDRVERFVEEVENEWICTMCQEVPVSPPNLPLCGHLFCQHELREWTETQLRKKQPLRCPNCRTPFSEQDLANVNAAHRNAINRRTIKCKCHEDGCPWTGQVGYEHRNVRKHEEKCDYVPRPCRLGCGVNVTAATREEHETNACPRRLVSCVQCGDRLPLFNLTSHQQASPSSDYPLTCAGYKICEFCFDNTSTGLRPRLVRHDDFGSHQVLCGSRLAPCTACTNAHSMPLIEHLQHYIQIGGDGQRHWRVSCNVELLQIWRR